jgi:hypothetical protein
MPRTLARPADRAAIDSTQVRRRACRCTFTLSNGGLSVSRAIALLIGATLALSLVACGSDQSSPPVDTGTGPSPTAAGVWEANDDGIYYLRETGDGRLWWFGTDVGRTTGNTFSNVAVGQIDGDVIQLEWADVPYGTSLGRGDLTLQVSADGHTLTKIEATGGFGGSTWTLLIKCTSPGASENPEASETASP